MTTSSAGSAFLYVAVRPGGGRKFGLRQAGSVPALATSLRAENQLLLKTYRLPAWAAQEHRLSLKDQAELNEQLAQLLSRGVPLVEALEVVAQTVRPAGRPMVLRMRDLVSGGMGFADACKTVGSFDNVTIAVYRGAERTGDLAGAAKELSHTARRRLAIANKTVTVLLYPLITLSIAVVVGCVLLLYVVPMIADGLGRLDIRMPFYSRMVFGASQWMRENVIGLVIGVAALLAVLLVARGALMNGLKLLNRKLPVLKQLTLAQESARFFSVMAALTRTGIPIGDALTVANQVITHPQMRAQLDRLRQRLIEGGLLRLLIDEVDTLPIATRRLLVAAERAGDMESAFGTLAQDMTDQVERTSERAVAVLEPVAIIVLFLLIGSLMLSIMLPMLSLTNQVRL